MMHTLRILMIALLAVAVTACGSWRGSRDSSAAAPLVVDRGGLPAVASLRQVESDVYSAGQPSAEELAAYAGAGITTVIDLRGDDEDRGYDELGAALDLGLDYVTLPIDGVDAMTPSAVAAFTDAIDRARGPVLVHCRSGSRVGAMMALRAARQGASVDEAMRKGIAAGMGESLQAPLRARLGQSQQP